MARSRAYMAFEAMKAIGISSKVVKPVLKHLLQLYDNNWEVIEEENYRVLADAIFDSEDSKIDRFDLLDQSMEDTQKETSVNEELMPPKARQRSRQEADRSAASVCNSGTVIGEPLSKRPKLDNGISPRITRSQEETRQFLSHANDREKSIEPVLIPMSIQGKTLEAVSHHICIRETRTEPPQPQIPPREKGPIHEFIPNKICFKEPMTEPGIDLLPKGVVPTEHPSNALIKPKCEPFTGDFPQFEVPIAVIHPQLPHIPRDEDQVSKDGPFEHNFSGQTYASKAPASQPIDSRAKKEDALGSTCQNGANRELVSVPEASSANFEIASSAHGEVKLSLTCNSIMSDFHMPSLVEVLKLVEDKCLRSYKIIEPTFSVINLVQEMCQCFVELSTDSTDKKLERHVNRAPTLDFLKESNTQNALGAKCDPVQGNLIYLGSFSNGSSDSHYPPEVSEAEKDMKKLEFLQDPELNSCGSVVFQQHQSSLGKGRLLHDVNDISKGEERVRISLVNEVSSEQYPLFFYYIPRNIVYQNAYVNFSLARVGDEDCCSDCFGDCLSSPVPCACACETGGEYAYTLGGLLKKEFLDVCISMSRYPQKHHQFYCKACPLERSKNEAQPDHCKGHLVRKFIKECWSKCGCSKKCGNRVVQRGIVHNLQVFYTSEGKGWGLRSLDELPRGTFVCEYVGEVLTNAEVHNRNMQGIGSKKHHYQVLLDADWCSGGVLKDEQALCLDAKFYGNVARFINHRCFDANLVEIPVEVETPDHHYYHLAFFTTRKIEALEELTWDYGINFDDDNILVKTFRCRCGSKFCQDMKRQTGSEESALVLS